jgi:choline dehydrogenase-like flavoprotein
MEHPHLYGSGKFIIASKKYYPTLYTEESIDRYSAIAGLFPSCHQMGTTRMHIDPTQGVVDENCRVHGISNLYIAGSSVFPTGGSANPTLNIVALAIRLADYIKEQKY